MTLAPDFPCISALSADPADVPHSARRAEIERELHRRRPYYTKRVDLRRMTQTEADHEIDCMKAILADLDGDMSAGAAFSWEAKIHCLRREIAMRRKFYPEWIVKGSVDKAQAKLQLERIEAVHFAYWRHMDHWRPDGATRMPPLFSEAGQYALDQVRRHMDRFDPHGRRGEYAAGTSASLPQPEPEFALA